MVHVIAILFFAGLLVALALVLQYTIRESWPAMAAAMLGRPMPRHKAARTRPVTVSVPRSRRLRRAAA